MAKDRGQVPLLRDKAIQGFPRGPDIQRKTTVLSLTQNTLGRTNNGLDPCLKEALALDPENPTLPILRSVGCESQGQSVCLVCGVPVRPLTV